MDRDRCGDRSTCPQGSSSLLEPEVKVAVGIWIGKWSIITGHFVFTLNLVSIFRCATEL
jgi:hypothetical protein